MSATPKPTVGQRLVGAGESLLKTNPMVMMTPDFMLPKQLRGSALTDIYNKLPAPLRNDTARATPNGRNESAKLVVTSANYTKG